MIHWRNLVEIQKINSRKFHVRRDTMHDAERSGERQKELDVGVWLLRRREGTSAERTAMRDIFYGKPFIRSLPVASWLDVGKYS